MKPIYFALIVLGFFSCKQNEEAAIKIAPSQKKEISKMAGDLNVTNETVAITFKTETATQVHQAYLELKGALVNTDAAEAAAVAGEFKQMLEEVGENTAFKKLAGELEDIASTKDAAAQRVTFEEVSKKVENYLSQEVATGSLIKQYCPMAFDGKGAYWLSDSKEVRNPYFGDQMLKCGVVDKEIQ